MRWQGRTQSGDRPTLSLLSLKVSRPTCVLVHKHECTWLRLLGHSNKDVPADCLAPNACKHENQNARDPGYTRTASGSTADVMKRASTITRQHASTLGEKLGRLAPRSRAGKHESKRNGK